MDCAPNINIFRELQVVLDTGYFSGQISPEEDWQQVSTSYIVNSKSYLISRLYFHLMYLKKYSKIKIFSRRVMKWKNTSRTSHV